MAGIFVRPGKVFKSSSRKGDIRINVRAFFDTAKVMSVTSRAERRVLTTVGGRVRLTAKRSIRNRKKSSRPGQAPTNKTGLLRNFIFFFFDFVRRSVIIGPEKLALPGQTPMVLEEGGQTTIRLRRRKKEKKTSKRRRVKRVTIKARPYMGPALRKELVKLPQLWRDSIK